MDSYFYFQQPNLFQFECKCRDKISVSGTLYLIKIFGIRYIVPNTENSYFPMSSTMYLIPKKKMYLIPNSVKTAPVIPPMLQFEPQTPGEVESEEAKRTRAREQSLAGKSYVGQEA